MFLIESILKIEAYLLEWSCLVLVTTTETSFICLIDRRLLFSDTDTLDDILTV